MSLTNAGRAYGGAGGFPEKNEICKYDTFFFDFYCKLNFVQAIVTY